MDALYTESKGLGIRAAVDDILITTPFFLSIIPGKTNKFIWVIVTLLILIILLNNLDPSGTLKNENISKFNIKICIDNIIKYKN